MKPESEAALADAIRAANGPLAVRGGATRGMSPEGTVLETGGLRGIALYEPGALTIVAGAGTPLAEIEAALAAENQRLAFEPMDHRGLLGTSGEPTFGAVFACNISGPRRIQAGAARDFALGVRFVDGAGQIVKNGGRVMKNVTGYDLVKLMCGARGTLGVLTEVSLKVLPVPETQATLVLHGLDDGAALKVISAALGSPFEVSGAAHSPDPAPETLLRVEGFEASVAYRADRLRSLLAGHGAEMEIRGAEASAALWRDVRDVAPFHAADGDVWRVSCTPSDAPGIAERAGARARFFDWGGGLVWLLTEPGNDLRSRIAPLRGHATLVRADAATHAALGTHHPEASGVATLTEGLRRRFDPRGLLSSRAMDQA